MIGCLVGARVTQGCKQALLPYVLGSSPVLPATAGHAFVYGGREAMVDNPDARLVPCKKTILPHLSTSQTGSGTAQTGHEVACLGAGNCDIVIEHIERRLQLWTNGSGKRGVQGGDSSLGAVAPVQHANRAG